MSAVVASLLGTLSSAAAQFVTDEVAAYRGARQRSAGERRAAADAVSLSSAAVHPFVETLRPEQVDALSRLFRGPVFEHLVRHMVVAVLDKLNEESRLSIREQVRHNLRHTGAFDDGDLLQAADVVVHLLDVAVSRVLNKTDAASTDQYMVAVAADIAAAGVRNGEFGSAHRIAPRDQYVRRRTNSIRRSTYSNTCC